MDNCLTKEKFEKLIDDVYNFVSQTEKMAMNFDCFIRLREDMFRKKLYPLPNFSNCMIIGRMTSNRWKRLRESQEKLLKQTDDKLYVKLCLY